MNSLTLPLLAAMALLTNTEATGQSLAIATFRVDATPPLGSPLCDGGVAPAKKIVDPLSARGIILLTDKSPIVLCAVDWVGIGNSGYDEWRRYRYRSGRCAHCSSARHSGLRFSG